MALRRLEEMIRMVEVLTVVSNWRQSPTSIPLEKRQVFGFTLEMLVVASLTH